MNERDEKMETERETERKSRKMRVNKTATKYLFSI